MEFDIFSEESLIQFAVIQGDDKKVEKLIKAGFNVNNRKYCMSLNGELVFGVTPLHAAAFNNNTRSAFILINAGADVNTKTGLAKTGIRKTGLEKAELEKAELEKAELEKAELEKAGLEKAGLEKTGLEKTGLKKAELEKAGLEKAGLEKTELKKTELEKTGPENSRMATFKSGFTSLHIACIYNNRSMTELLIAAGADLNLEDDFGRIALEYALKNTVISCILIANGANFRCADDVEDKIPLLFEVIRDNNLEMTQLLASLQEELVYYQNQTPIEYAMEVFPESVETLICYGIGVDEMMPNGETLLHHAIKLKKENWIKILLEMHADPNAKDSVGNRPLHYAVHYRCSLRVLLKLLEYGADPNFTNEEGLSPIFYAIDDECVELTDALLRYDTIISPQYKELSSAIDSRQPKTALLLLLYFDGSLNSYRFKNEPVIWYFVQYVVGTTNTLEDLLKVMKLLIEKGCDLNSIHVCWGTLMHFFIYAMVCVPSEMYRYFFKALIDSPGCDLNQQFFPQDAETPDGRFVIKREIVAFGTALSFAFSQLNTHFFAELLIVAGAKVDSIDWDKFIFEPEKIKALKMLFYCGCKFPHDFVIRCDPQQNIKLQLMSIQNPDIMECYKTQFWTFCSWLNHKHANPLSLKQICRLFIRNTHGANIKLYLNQMQKSLPQALIKYIRFVQFSDEE